MKHLVAVLILTAFFSGCARRVTVSPPEFTAQDRIVAVLNSNLESHEKVAFVRDILEMEENRGRNLRDALREILGWATAVIAVAK